ncbi:unnamed protein product, partial [Musa acuminata subsp. burmannicoides]
MHKRPTITRTYEEIKTKRRYPGAEGDSHGFRELLNACLEERPRALAESDLLGPVSHHHRPVATAARLPPQARTLRCTSQDQIPITKQPSHEPQQETTNRAITATADPPRKYMTK